MTFPLHVFAGSQAKAELEQNGWRPEIFSALVGASGGAKLLGIAHLDRAIFNNFLCQSDHPMELYGSSIGSWRHAALASGDTATALKELQDRYLNQTFDPDDPRTPREVVDGLCEWVLDGFINPAIAQAIVDHPRFTTHIITARGKGLNNREADTFLGLGMATSGIANAVYRPLLSIGFQRVVFSSGPATAFNFKDFDSLHVPLDASSLKPALTASGSIPFLMSGVPNIGSAPPGHYWDGGIIDYHFDFSNQAETGLILYPHFGQHVIKGWFDKKIPWRRNSADLLSRTVVIAPSQHYLSELPNGKIPDRNDFSRYSTAERLANWQTAVEHSRLLAEAFEEVVSATNPLDFVAD